VSARRKARKRAVDALFAADVKSIELAEAVAEEKARAAAEPLRASSWEYAEVLLDGVVANAEEIDRVISETSTSWPLERMPSVDRAVVRLATWELLFNPDVPPAVVIAEAVALVNELSTEASGGFVHGLLAALADKHNKGGIPDPDMR
jgi:transcription antitermination protein NusB